MLEAGDNIVRHRPRPSRRSGSTPCRSTSSSAAPLEVSSARAEAHDPARPGRAARGRLRRRRRSSSESKPLTKAEYQAQLEQTAKEIGDQLGKTQNDIDKTTDAELNQFSQEGVDEFADELEKMNPPDEVAHAHKRLMQAMRELGDEFPEDLQEGEGAPRTPSGGDRLLFGTPAIRRADQAQQEFKAKGYDLNLNG